NAVTEAVKACIEEHVQPLQDEVKGLKSSIIQLENELEQTKRLVQPLNDTVIALEDFVLNLENEITRLSFKANDYEQYSRRYNVRIYGCPEENGEICSAKVDNVCRNEMKVEGSSVDQIDRCHRVGRPRTDGKPRAIIVRFKSHKSKLCVMKAKKNLKGTPYFINEDLTSVNQKLYFTARTGCLNVATVWSTDGKIFVKRQTDDRKFQITHHSDFGKYELK
ncbi:Hypothetical predicted protein, partial [Paramuricea clavata]